MLEQLVAETTDCDFKSAVERDKPKSWLKSVSAFANTYGGTLIFGVENESHQTLGLKNPQADADFISEKIKERIDPLPAFEVETAEDSGKHLLLVRVHADTHTPHYYNTDGRREAFVRVGSQSVPASSEILNELILKGTNRTWDVLDSGIPKDRASFTVLKATYAQRTGKDLLDTDLASFGLVGDSSTLTNAGALFADEALVRHSRVFCTRWTGLHKESPTDDAEISGSLLTLLREGEAFVRRHNILSWKKTPNSRLNYRCYAERAATESLVNALVHRSYLDLGSEVHIDIYDNRLTISSPGAMIKGPLPKDVLNSSIESRRRNPVICDVFSRLNLMERRGTGLQEICRATMAEDAFRPEYMPQFEEEGDVFRVTLWNMKYESDGEKVHGNGEETARNGEKVHGNDLRLIVSLSQREQTALTYLRSKPRAARPEISSALGLSSRGTLHLLNRLISKGLVERVGNGRTTSYKLSE